MATSGPESGIVVPVPALDPVVGAWRARWDPAAALAVPAHVTLLYPFVPPPVPAAVVGRLAGLLAGVRAWDVTYASLARFPGDPGSSGDVLYVEPSPAAPFADLVRLLAAAWPEHPPYGGAYETVVPHLTVCDGAPDDVCAAAAAAVSATLPVVTRATEAVLMEQSAPGGPYAVTARFPFA